MKRTSTYKDGHAPINLTRALCMITLLIDGARKIIRVTNRLHNLAVLQKSHIQALRKIIADHEIIESKDHQYPCRVAQEFTKFDNASAYLPNPSEKHNANRIANDFSHEIDRITDILHDNSGYKWIDNTE